MAICGYRCTVGEYHPPPRFVGQPCIDLVSGRRYDSLPSTIGLLPLESLVLVLRG